MLTLKAFGALDFRDDEGASITSLLAQPKRSALLAYLVLAHPSGFCRRDTLFALFWPDLDQEAGRNALSQALTFLRHQVGSSVLVTRGQDEVGVDAGHVGSDVEEFRSALGVGEWAEAVRLYRGELLEGLHVAGAAPFVDWVDRERRWFREKAAQSAWNHARALLAAGNLKDAVLTAEQALALVPTDEAAVRDFIHGLAAGGDRAAALRFYEEFVKVLDGELGVEPAAETREVADAVRAGRVRGPAVEAQALPSPAHLPAPEAGGGERAVAPPTPGAGAPSGRRRAATVGLVVIGVLAVAAWALRDRIAPVQSAGERSPVVVVPFEVHGTDGELVAAGEQAALLLAQALEGAGLGNATAYRDSGEGRWTRALGRRVVRETKAGTLVTGVIAVRGGAVEVSASVVRGADLETLWTLGPESGRREDLSRLLEAVRERALGAVGWYLGPEMALHSAPEIYQPPPSLAVLRLATRGHELYQAGDREGALAQYRAAFALDTTWLHGALEVAKHSSSYSAWWVQDFWVAATGNAQRDSVVRFVETRRGRLSPGDALQLDVFAAAGRSAGELYRAARSLAAADSFFLAPMLMQAALWQRRPLKALEIYEGPTGSRILASPLWAGRADFQAAEAYHMLGRFEEELALARAARARDPGLYLHFAREMRALSALGRADEMERLIDESFSLDIPDPDVALLNEAQVELRAHGPPELARDVATRLLARLEGRPPGFAWDARRYALEVLGRYREAWFLWEESSRRAGDDLGYRIRGVRDRILVGDTTGAAALANSARTAPMEAFAGFGWSGRGQPLYFGAQVLGMLGWKAEALAMFREALNNGFRLTRDEELQWYWSPLRDEPAFREIVRLRDGG